MTKEADAIIREYAEAHREAAGNPALLLKSHAKHVDLCVLRMRRVENADRRLSELRGAASLPSQASEFFKSQDYPGCSSCWISSHKPKKHEECNVKIARYFSCRATLIEYGALSTDPTPFPLFLALGKGLVIRGYTLLEVTLVPDVLAAGKKFVLEGLANGSLKPVIDRTFSFEEIQAAHEYMASNQQMGKIVVTL